MTRRPLALFGGVLLFCGAAINAPAPAAEGAAIPPEGTRPIAHASPLNIRLGDGILRLRIQLCDRCGARLSFEINLLRLARPEGQAYAVNHQPSAA